MTAIEIGRLLRAGTQGFVAGCRTTELDSPEFGALVRVPLDRNTHIYGLIHDMRIDDDGLVRQLAATDGLDDTILLDNRLNRSVPVELHILSVGYAHDGQVRHMLPPRPPLSLDILYLCEDEELVSFTSSGRFGYFRHILRATDLPVGEILAAHMLQTGSAQAKGGNSQWIQQATQELIILLRDDYPTLMSVLGALSEIHAEVTLS